MGEGGEIRWPLPHFSDATDEIHIGKIRVGGKNIHRPIASASYRHFQNYIFNSSSATSTFERVGEI